MFDIPVLDSVLYATTSINLFVQSACLCVSVLSFVSWRAAVMMSSLAIKCGISSILLCSSLQFNCRIHRSLVNLS